MPAPRSSSAYPVEFRLALIQAVTLGDLFIPHANPASFRLQLYGYISALRREGSEELADACSFFLEKDPPGVRIRLKEKTEMAKSIRAAIERPQAAAPADAVDDDEINRLFERITKG